MIFSVRDVSPRSLPRGESLVFINPLCPAIYLNAWKVVNRTFEFFNGGSICSNFLMEGYGVIRLLEIVASQNAASDPDNQSDTFCFNSSNQLRLQVHLPQDGFVAGVGA